MTSQELQTLRVSACLNKPVQPAHLYTALVLVGQGRFVQAGDIATTPLPAGCALAPSYAETGWPSVPVGESSAAPILLVDDNATNREVALLALEALGYRADVAVQGGQALAMIERAHHAGHPYHMILMDCQMPVMDGYAATHQLRQLEHAHGWVPAQVIAMTAHAMTGDREKCLAAGMDDYLSKPLDIPQLNRVLTQRLASPDVILPVPGSAGASSVPCWDQQALCSLVRGKPERMQMLLDSFLGGLDEQHQAIIRSVESLDRDELARALHRLKGSAANLGARRLPQLLGDCERDLTVVGQLHEARLVQLSQQIAQLKAEMSAYLANPGSLGALRL